MSSQEKLKQIVEAALLAAGRPLSLEQLQTLFEERERPDRKVLRETLESLMQDYPGRGIEVVEVGSGFRIQVRAEFSPWVSRLWAERAPKYSRALLETLALIAYRQPITRGEIEDIRGVSVSSNIIKSLTEREWVRVVGHRDVPGKPALYATTKEFLDYFNLKSLNELPTLTEIRDLDSINRELELNDPERRTETGDQGSADADAETDDGTIARESELILEEEGEERAGPPADTRREDAEEAVLEEIESSDWEASETVDGETGTPAPEAGETAAEPTATAQRHPDETD